VLAAVPDASLADSLPTPADAVQPENHEPAPPASATGSDADAGADEDPEVEANRDERAPRGPDLDGAVGPGDGVVRGSVGRHVRAVVAVVGLACLVSGGLAAWTGEPPRLAAPSVAAPAPLAPAPPAPPGSTDSTDSTDSTVAPAGTSPASTSPVAPTGSSTAACGDPTVSCSDVRPAGVVDHDGSRFAIGRTDDELVVADPRCARPPAVALLRPADGTTWLYDRWADPGHDVAARQGPVVPAGSRWEPRPIGADGCASLAVRTPDGDTVAVADDPTGPDPAAADPVTEPGGPR